MASPFLEQCAAFRDNILLGDSPVASQGWNFAVSAQESYNQFGTDGFIVLEDATAADDAVVYRRARDGVIHLAFRGTVSGDQWMSTAGNLQLEKQTLTWLPPGSGTVAGGFAHAYSKLREVLIKHYREWSAPKIQISGHSRGAVLAVLSGLDLACNFGTNDVEIVVWACPRMGDDEFRKFYHSMLQIQLASFSLAQDPVPMLPPAAWQDDVEVLELLYPSAKEAIRSGFSHIVDPLALDEAYAESMLVQVAAGILIGNPADIHSMDNYKIAYTRFFMKGDELFKDVKPKIQSAVKARFLMAVSSLWSGRSNTATLRELHYLKQQGINTHRMLVSMAEQVSADMIGLSSQLHEVSALIEDEFKLNLQAQLTANMFAAQSCAAVYFQAMDGRSGVTAAGNEELLDSLAAGSGTSHWSWCRGCCEGVQEKRELEDAIQNVRSTIVEIVSRGPCARQTVGLLMGVMGALLKMELMTGLSYSAKSETQWEMLMQFIGPLVETVFQELDSEEALDASFGAGWQCLRQQWGLVEFWSDSPARMAVSLKTGFQDQLRELEVQQAWAPLKNRIDYFNTTVHQRVRSTLNVVCSPIVVHALVQANTSIPLQERDAKKRQYLALAREKSDEIHEKMATLESAVQRPKVLFMGRISSGKTTLIVALIKCLTGQLVELPMNELEATGAITVIHLSTETPQAGRVGEFKYEANAPKPIAKWDDFDFTAIIKNDAHEGQLPRAVVTVYGSTSELEFVDTPGAEGHNINFHEELKDSVFIPVYVCSFASPTWFDAASSTVMKVLQGVPGAVKSPLVMFFSRHQDSIITVTRQNKSAVDDSDPIHRTQTGKQIHVRNTIMAMNKFACTLQEQKLTKPFAVAINTWAVVNAEDADPTEEAEASEHLQDFVSNLLKMTTVLMPLLSTTRTMGEIEYSMQEMLNTVFESDSSKALLTDARAIAQAQAAARHEMCQFIEGYLAEDIKNRDGLARDPFSPSFYLISVGEKEMIKKGKELKGWQGRSQKQFVADGMQTMLAKWQDKFFADILTKQEQVMRHELQALITDLSDERKQELLKATRNYWDLSTMALSYVAVGAVTGFAASGVAWMFGAAVIGPPGWVVGVVAGVGGLAIWGRQELGFWTVEDAASLATDEVVKYLSDKRPEFIRDVSNEVCKSVDGAFEDLKKLRVINRDDSGTLLDCQKEMSDLGLQNKYLALKVLEAMRKCNTVMRGQGPPTTFLRESVFADPDQWPELKLSDDELVRHKHLPKLPEM